MLQDLHKLVRVPKTKLLKKQRSMIKLKTELRLKWKILTKMLMEFLLKSLRFKEPLKT